MPRIKFLVDYPVALIEKKKALVITDLHLGIENDLYQSGIVISPQADKFARIIEKIVDDIKAKLLIILGDVKHEVPGTSFREMKQIPKFFSSIADKVKVVITKGNHDTNLEDLLPSSVKICSSKGFKLGRYGFFHGHAWPSKALMRCDYLFLGHIQPALEFCDSFGYKSIEQVWLKGKLDAKKVKEKYRIKKVGKLNVFLVPSFNKLLGSLVLNRTPREELLGPLLTRKIIDIEKCKVYLLDGTYLGKLGRIEF